MSAHHLADRLDAAADSLLADGWTQLRPRGRHGERCLLTAINDSMEREDRYPAIGAVMQELGLAYDPERGFLRLERLTQWNDKHERTIDDVVDVLRKAAKSLRET